MHVVSPRIDPATRTLRVKARVENAERKLRPGLFARADLGVAMRERVLMVPEEAVLQRSDGEVVFGCATEPRQRRRCGPACSATGSSRSSTASRSASR